ncbi:MAG: hypothetical protein AAFV62_09565, partial [Pseudomonadota bacterium]
AAAPDLADAQELESMSDSVQSEPGDSIEAAPTIATTTAPITNPADLDDDDAYSAAAAAEEIVAEEKDAKALGAEWDGVAARDDWQGVDPLTELEAETETETDKGTRLGQHAAAIAASAQSNTTTPTASAAHQRAPVVAMDAEGADLWDENDAEANPASRALAISVLFGIAAGLGVVFVVIWRAIG